MVLDTSSIALPSTGKDATPPKVPVTSWYPGYDHFNESVMTPHGIVELVELNKHGEVRYKAALEDARQNGRTMTDWDDKWRLRSEDHAWRSAGTELPPCE